MAYDRSLENIVSFVRSLQSKDIRDEDKKRLISNYIESKARERLIPVNGYFELTPLCNLDCKMCYIHLDSRLFSQNALLSVSTWKSLMLQAYKAGMRSAALTGGECLTYPGFDELFLFLRGMNISVDILSNGLLIDKKRIDFFLKHQPQMIKVSLYGSCDDAYEAVTGHRVFNIVYRNLQMIRDSGLPVCISITPNRFMQNDMLKLIEMVESLNIRYEINARLLPPRANTGRSVEDLSLDQYIELYRLRLQYHNQSLVPNDPAELPDENQDGPERRGLQCGAGRSSFAIKYDGSMCPCISLDELAVPALELGFEEAWKRVIEYAKDYPIPCECNNCSYLPICIQCQAVHKNAPNGHCDTKICERTKRLAQAGFFQYNGKGNGNTPD